MILHLFIVVISQFLFIFFRTLNVKYVADNGVLGAMLTGLMVNILWITTTAYGLTALHEQNWILGGAYLAGGQIGVYYGMRKAQFTKYFLQQWLNLKVAVIHWHIRKFAKYDLKFWAHFNSPGAYDTIISWRDITYSYPSTGTTSPSQLKKRVADIITSNIIDKFYKKHATIFSTPTT